MKSYILLAVALMTPAVSAQPRTQQTQRTSTQRRVNSRARVTSSRTTNRVVVNPVTRQDPTTAQRGAQQTPPTQQTPTADAGPGQPIPNQQVGTLTAEQVVERVQGFYDRTTDFEADFSQETRNRLSGTPTTRTGHVRFLRPGRMRWEYANPSGDLIVSNGTTLWAYEAAAHQAIQTNLQESQLPSALSFLMGTGRLTAEFTGRLLDATRYRYANGYVLELRPNTPSPSVERLVLYVEPTNFQVVRSAVFDSQGNRNVFEFTRPQVNMHPAESVFTWTPPQGTQIIHP